MEIKKISCGQMPPRNKYVLIFVPGRPWSDSDDEYGKYWKVAKCVYGISQEQRKAMLESGSFFEVRRAKTICFGDEFGNNIKPYQFREFGSDTYFGQEVDIWCELPAVEVRE